MKSTVTFTVEHGETTDLLTQFAEEAEDLSTNYFDYTSYEVAVDIENAPAKTVLPEAVYSAIRSGAIALENTDSASLISQGLMLGVWLDTHTEIAD